MSTDLSNKVMLITLNISCFTGQRVDANASEDIASRHATTASEAGNYSKQIISKHSLKAIRVVANTARQVHYERTLPWSDTGSRILSVIGYGDYANHIANLREMFNREIDAFLDVYPRLIEEARRRLNGLFDADDYPDISTMRGRFRMSTNATPLPSSKNWFLQLADDTMNELRASNEARLNENLEAAVRDTYKRVAEVTSTMATKLQAYDPENKQGVFRDSLVENVREITNLLPSLNITNDAHLAAITDEMRRTLCAIEPGVLRQDPKMRGEVAVAATSIYDKLKGFY